MRISGLIKNDVVNGINVCVSLWTQGCPFHCPNCHNQQTWDFNSGYEVDNIKDIIINAIKANGVQRNFSILGGEPLCPENVKEVKDIILAVREAYPNITIFIWTGYTLDQLLYRKTLNEDLEIILSNVDFIIDGLFEQEQKDYTLWLRGSKNQNVYYRIFNKENKFIKVNRIDSQTIVRVD